MNLSSYREAGSSQNEGTTRFSVLYYLREFYKLLFLGYKKGIKIKDTRKWLVANE